MKSYLGEIRLLLVRLSIALLAYPVCKILFFIFNHSYFSDVSFGEFAFILFFGLRFDISSLVLMNAPFIILHIVPFGFTRKKWYQIVLRSVFLIVNGIAVLADCVDLEYYKYTMKRTTSDFFDLFGLGSDVATLLPQYFKDFWYVVLIWIGMIVFISWLYGKTGKKDTGRNGIQGTDTKTGASPISAVLQRIFSWLFLTTALIGLLIIAFRGGLQLRPIMTINGSEYVSAKNIPLIINTPFSIIKSYGLEQLEEKIYFPEKDLSAIFDPIQTGNRSSDMGQRTNVFLIILESFSKEYIGALSGKKTNTPFLDSLIGHSLVFDNAYANGKKSIEGIPAVLAGIPSLMNESYITSSYCGNNFNSIANSLKEIGYSSAFFHGGTRGTMGFDAFCGASGFDHYYGREEYNNEKDYDGSWGIWDEEFLQFTQKSVTKMKEPFFASLFTLTSHHPNRIPEKYAGKFGEGELPIYKSIQYSDFSLRKFFESASKEKWFDNTLFVITADHTGPSNDPYYSGPMGSFAVPVIFYKHSSALKGKDHRVAQQIDIMPSILNYIGFDQPYFSLGNNLFDSTGEGFSVNFINDVYQLTEGNYLLQFDGQKPIGLFNYTTDSLLQVNLVGSDEKTRQKMEVKIKALIQIYTSGMIHNRMAIRTAPLKEIK